MSTPGERLTQARERAGFDSAKSAALAMGVPIATYTQHEKAAKHLPYRRADEYAQFFKVTPEYILYGRGETPDRLPVLDCEGRDTGRTAALPPTPSEITQAIEGDGLAHFGMVAIYNEPQSRRAPLDIDGRLCVVAIYTDDVLCRVVRIVKPGTQPGRYHLIGQGMPMIDHEVLWIAPVVALVPG